MFCKGERDEIGKSWLRQPGGASMKIYWELFSVFFRMGAITFGGGYAMLPILQREVVDARGWCTNEELTDYYAIGQCTPGIIAVNTATFIGFKLKGVAGALLATYGVVAPSFIIIGIIAALLQNFADYAVVQNAFAGIRVAVAVLIFNAVCKLYKSSVIDKTTLAVFVAVALLAVFLDVSPVLFVVAAGLLGVAVSVGKEARKR